MKNREKSTSYLAKNSRIREAVWHRFYNTLILLNLKIFDSLNKIKINKYNNVNNNYYMKNKIFYE